MVKKQAYLILAHNAPQIFHELVKKIDFSNHDIFVHVDRKTPIDDFIAIRDHVKYSKIYFLENRFEIKWGSYNIVKAEIELLKTALRTNEYSYLHLLSGVDALIEDKEEIFNFYNDSKAKQFIHFWKEDEMQKNLFMDRYKTYDILLPKNRNKLNKLLYHSVRYLSITLQKFFRIERNSNINFYMGSQWFSITDTFAQYLIGKEKEIDNIFRRTLCPDESFVQTLFMNSSFCEGIIINMDNDYSRIKRCIDFTHGTPKVWGRDDVEYLKSSSNFFARKFDDVEVVKQLSVFKSNKR